MSTGRQRVSSRTSAEQALAAGAACAGVYNGHMHMVAAVILQLLLEMKSVLVIAHRFEHRHVMDR
jgi:hypothetical protein